MTVLPDSHIDARCQPIGYRSVDELLMSNPPQQKIVPFEQTPMLEPYDPAQLQPASYDVRLGNDFRVFQRDETPFIDLDSPDDITKLVHIDDDEYFLLHPGEFVLGTTREVVHMPDDLVARIEGKSSVGRLGLMVHVTAGYIDPGFEGTITLEMAGLHPLPIKLRPGKLIAQLSFHEMTAPAKTPYNGRYQGDKTAVSSRYDGRL